GKFAADATQLPTGCQPESLAKPAHRRSHKATQPELLTRRELDGRTSAAKAFDRLVADIESDLGGSDRLSAIEPVPAPTSRRVHFCTPPYLVGKSRVSFLKR